MYIGFDIGGSSVKAVLAENKKIIKSKVEDLPDNLSGLLDLLEKIFNEFKKDVDKIGGPARNATPARHADARLQRLQFGQASHAGWHSVAGGVGVALAGAIDAKREVMLNSPNITYLNNQPLKKLIGGQLGCEVRIEHDVHCFLLAEKEIGLAKDLKNVFYLTLGTGIGGAFMVDGKIVFGSHGSAGELGHMIIDIENDFELEDLAANKFIKKNLGAGSMKAREMVGAGDEKAIEVIKQMSANLGVGIANIINIFDPEAIIISGGINWAKDFILEGINQAVERFVISPEAKKTKILFSNLDRFGGAMGAALMAKNG